MLQFMKYEENFEKYMQNTDRKLAVYGVGAAAQIAYPYLRKISYVFDQKADGILRFHNIIVMSPEKLQTLSEKLVILICVKGEYLRYQIREFLEQYNHLDAVVFEFYNNVAFDCFHPEKYMRNEGKIEYIRLVCQDKEWILGKFAQKMQEQLERRGIKAVIGECSDLSADINHYIAYPQYEPILDSRDTLMITHIDSLNKVNLLKHQMKMARMGICMSRETMNYLTMCGVPREKLCYINPAQDGVMKIKKYVLGITHKNHETIDNRKRIGALLDICGALDPMYFQFRIMGSGWEKVVKQMKDMGYDVEYYSEFDYDKYMQLIPTFDYYLFWGFDEGSMGYLDALAAGVETIVTPQGYHLDIKDGITYPCRVVQDFTDVLLELQNKRKKRVLSVAQWTWENYVDKHLEVWRYLLGLDKDIYMNKHKYEDGIFSVISIEA